MAALKGYEGVFRHSLYIDLSAPVGAGVGIS